MGSLPTRFWVTTGIGIHPEHSINAYDQALYMAGISEQNIIAVSSVPPADMIYPKIIDGITYVPAKVLEGAELQHYIDNIDKYQKMKSQFEHILPKPHVFEPVHLPTYPATDTDSGPYYKLKNSWCINVVLARSSAEQFERMTSSIGLGWYKIKSGGVGIYAVEDHGNKSIDGSIDNCTEMLERMMKFRKVEPLHSGFDSDASCSDEVLIYDGIKYPYENSLHATHSPEHRIYTISMDRVPEGFVGSAIAVVVFDPFTEVHA